MSKRTLILMLVMLFQLMLAGVAQAHPREPNSEPVPENAPVGKFGGIRFDPNLGAIIPENIQFRDETGATVTVGQYVRVRPVVLALAYYECPNLCTAVLNGMVDTLRKVPFKTGQDYDVVVVSIDPKEKPELARKKRDTYLRRFMGATQRISGQPFPAGWHFLTGDKNEIDRLASAVGFRYQYDSASKQYVHPAGLVVVGPGGKISRYLFGIQFNDQDLRFALVGAADGKIGTLKDQVLLLCYHYDPQNGKYSPLVLTWLKYAGIAALVALGLLVIFLTGVAHAESLWLPSASTVSGKVDVMFWSLVVSSGALLLVVMIAIVVFVSKYRASSKASRENRKSSLPLVEMTWMGIPLLIFVGLFVWAAYVYYDMNDPPKNSIEVYVTAKQWMWKFQYANGFREINELHVPLGKPVKLLMTSEDVIHSLYIPAFRLKHDVLPGRYVTTWFNATKPGTFDLACTQYCGTEHANMRGKVIVLNAADYARWQKASTPGQVPSPSTNSEPRSLAAAGRNLYQKLGCVQCHGADAAGTAQGPKLQGVFGSQVNLVDGRTVIADETYIRESILEPAAKIVEGYQPTMPSFKDRVSEVELQRLIAYLKSLKYAERSKPSS